MKKRSSSGKIKNLPFYFLSQPFRVLTLPFEEEVILFEGVKYVEKRKL